MQLTAPREDHMQEAWSVDLTDNIRGSCGGAMIKTLPDNPSAKLDPGSVS